jgi:hypothetical protein
MKLAPDHVIYEISAESVQASTLMFRAVLCVLPPSSLMMEAVRTSETSVDNHFTWQYNPEDSSEHHTCRRENLKSHIQF